MVSVSLGLEGSLGRLHAHQLAECAALPSPHGLATLEKMKKFWTCAGTKLCRKADAFMDRTKEDWKRKPRCVVMELSRACSATSPGEKKQLQQAKRSWKTPVAHCSLEVLPVASNEEGILQIKV